MKSLVLSMVMVACLGCDARISQFQAIGAKHHIELWSGGKMVREWTSTGKVLTETNSDGYYFCDVETQRLVRVTGDLVITPTD